VRRNWFALALLALAAPVWSSLPLTDFSHPNLDVDLHATLVLSQETWGVPLADANRIALEARITPDDFAVAAFLSREAGVGVDAIWHARQRGTTWFDVALNFGIAMDTLIIRPSRDFGPPYGKAWGYWKNHPKRGDRSFRLDDNDILRMVEVHTLCRSTGKSVDEVIQGLQGGDSYTTWASKVSREKHGKGAGAQGKGHGPHPSPGNGKGRGTGNGQGK